MIGDILGAGIYALVGEEGTEVGGAIWTAFLSALVFASFTAFPTPSWWASTRGLPAPPST